MKRKRGFTLIEVIVVIAIIGVLAAILVPTMMGYIRKSKRTVDIETGKDIYTNVISVLAKTDDVRDSFYNNGAGYSSPYSATEPNVNSTYKICWVAWIDGSTEAQASSDFIWNGVDTAASSFANSLNEAYDFDRTSTSVNIPIKMSGKTEDGDKINRWLVGYRKDDPQQIEVWVADGSDSSGVAGKPVSCIYPYVSENYH